jgi:hypothetical protein
MKKSLTPAQVAILQCLATRGPQARRNLLQAAAIGHNTYAKLFEALSYRGLVIEGEQKPGSSWRLAEITMAGRRALADLDNDDHPELDIVPPPVRCVAVPILPMRPYFRNNGNAHIQSRGLAC